MPPSTERNEGCRQREKRATKRRGRKGKNLVQKKTLYLRGDRDLVLDGIFLTIS